MQKKEKISQSSIKKDNVLSIFQEIVSSKGITRAEISEKTGLSLMTVGKVADSLTHHGILTQAKPATGSAGRRAGMLTLSERNFILVLDISTRKFRASVINLSLDTTDTLIYEYNDSLFPEDNLIIFFRETGSLLMKHLMDKKMLGTGICVPGEYDTLNDTVNSQRSKHLEGLKISATMKKSIGITPDRIMNASESAAISEISEMPRENCGCTVSLNIGNESFGCIAIDGKILSRPSDFDALPCENGSTLGRNLASITDEEILCRQIGSALKPIVSILCPDAIFICSNERYFSEWALPLIEKELKNGELPVKIIFENNEKARSDMGIAQLIRNDAIQNI